MRSAPVAAYAAFVAGCNGLLGLAETVPETGDIDHDGVLDSIDNCRGLANPDQSDRDGDGAGDACDPFPDGLQCPAGTPINRDADGNGVDDGCETCHSALTDDEDRDGIVDACDRCPGVADAGQEDEDADGIGDACDASPLKQRRLAFDGFDVDGAPDPDVFDAPGWKITGGFAVAPPSAPMTVVSLLTGARTGDWFAEAGVELPTPPTSAVMHDIAIEVTDETAAQKPARCGVQLLPNSTTWTAFVQAGVTGTVQSFGPPLDGTTVVRVALLEKQGSFAIECHVGGVLAVADASFAFSARVSFAASLDTRFSYVDLVH